MPDLSRTSLGWEIEYDLDNYKLNESSKADVTPSSDRIDTSSIKFKSISYYTRMKTEVQPKFMKALNIKNYQVQTSGDLNSSDKIEAQEIIDSLKCIDSFSNSLNK